VIGDMFVKSTGRNVRETGPVALSVTDPATDVACRLKGDAVYLESGPELACATEKLREKSPEKSLLGCVVVRLTAICLASRGKRAGELIAGEPV
jgi:hypothetical protein